jgi:hypothetical protein
MNVLHTIVVFVCTSMSRIDRFVELRDHAMTGMLSECIMMWFFSVAKPDKWVFYQNHTFMHTIELAGSHTSKQLYDGKGIWSFTSAG